MIIHFELGDITMNCSRCSLHIRLWHSREALIILCCLVKYIAISEH